MHARRQTRLGIKVKVRARFNLDLGGGRRAIRAECTAHCCAEHCRCAGAKPSTCYRDTDTLSPRINLRFSKFRRNFLLLISARIFRMREYFWCERRRLKKGKSPFGGKEGLIREPTIDPRRAGFLPFARVVPATSICRDSSGVYRQLPDPANFCLLGWQLAPRVDYHVMGGKRKPFLLSTTISPLRVSSQNF